MLYELVRETVLTTRNPALLPALILLGAAVFPLAFVVFISERRLVFGVRAGVVGLTALFGGVIGVVTAGTLEYDTLYTLGLLPMLGVGLIEEAAKLLVPAAVLLLLRANRQPADGLLLGVASGAGFAVLETMGYAFVVLVRSGGDLAVVNSLLFERGLLSPAAHMAWTGLAAAALWRAASERWRGRAVARFFGVYLLVAVLHAVWDSAGSDWAYAILALISLGLLTWTTHRLARTGSAQHARGRGAFPPRGNVGGPRAFPGPGAMRPEGP
jgi:RsiW-degrading membrane proteinase PrsW (M82 family)